jgi:PAS domain S-box-containing protein
LVFLLFTSIVIFYIAYRFIYWDRLYINILLKQKKQLTLFAELFEQLHESLVITNKQQEIIKINKAFEKTTGYKEAEVIGKPLHIINSGIHKKDYQIWKIVQEQGSWQGEFLNQRKDGKIYPEKLSISKITDDKGEITNYIGIFTDITKIRQAEGKIDFLTYYDPITQLPRRSFFLIQTDNHD